MTSKTLEGMADAAWSADDPSVSGKLRNLPATEALEVRRMKAAVLWLADRMEENGELTTDCKRAAVSAYLSTGQNGRGMVEPVRLMKAISAALRAAAEGTS